MPYLGKSLAGSSSIRRFNVTSSTSATHTLTWAPPTEQSIIVSINGVKQHEDAYSISGTTLTLTNALVATDKMEVIGINDVGTTVTAAQGSVNTDKLADDAVTTAKIANDQVTTVKIADDQVTTAKIANDQVTTAKIADDQITSAKLANAINITSGNSLTIDSGATITNNGTASGFGKVLQMQYSSPYSGSNISLTSGTPFEITTQYRVTITPISATSNILVMFYGTIHINNAYGGITPYVSTDGGSNFSIVNGSATSWSEMIRNSGAHSNCWRHHETILDTNVSAGARMYTMYGRANTSSLFRLNDNGGDSVLMVWEIET